ncbi:hypothetical protein BDV98DRAFT_255564 [Pterulicium gracile]|uniref:histidine kinase n=1 Tax=Pterulicium gracile TaxID=1884261 RepID=A0A5C3Q7H6_9AGAR|nr:hypothetical protein BDV98DRAFT_255564 [Pterula gracilis]
MARFPGAVASAACSQWTAATTTYDPEQALQPSEKFHEPEGLPLPAPAVHREPSSTSSRRRKKTVRHPRAWFREAWMGFKRRLRTATAPSSSSMHDQSTESHFSRVHVGLGASEEVDTIVVDRDWEEEFMRSSVAASEQDDHQHKTGSHPQNGTSVQDSFASQYLGWRGITHFFDSSFMDEAFERSFSHERWQSLKKIGLWASLWFVANWIMGIFVVPQPWALIDKVFNWGVAPALTLPIFVMVLFNVPRDHSKLYQVFITISVWSWSWYLLLTMYLCGNYNGRSYFSCGGKDFVGSFYYNIALQTIALVALGMKRFPATIGATVYFVGACVLIAPDRTTWARLMANFAIYHCLLIYADYMLENAQRRLYCLRSQLKKQYTATQRAQNNERKAADSKRRLTSYVFHEVRVPLNTALLAVQNMTAQMESTKDAGTDTRSGPQGALSDQDIEFSALVGSLTMMSKVLNDVLDFNRMDSGKFESVSRPYSFHEVMQSLLVPLRLATQARGLDLDIDLDPQIDRVVRHAAYEALGETEESIHKHMAMHPDVHGVVMGDETRLRQIITNLASNACKFTHAGGKLTIKTRLIYPTDSKCNKYPGKLSSITDYSSPEYFGSSANGDTLIPPSEGQDANSERNEEAGSGLKQSLVEMHNQSETAAAGSLERIVVRIEVQDTGSGIAPEDMYDGKLFSAFIQTEQGRRQGGKGTGLGLALVRQIVKLSGGRLGLKSRLGEGSTFWVEIPLGVGLKTVAPQSKAEPELELTSPRDGNTKHVGWHRRFSDPTTDTLMLLDAAALRAARKQPADERPMSALPGLMEHGGRVELTLAKTDSKTSLPTSANTTTSSYQLDESMITVQSRLTQEDVSRTSLSIPPQRPPPPEAQLSGSTIAPCTPPPPSPPPLNVLVVDDDAVTRMLMKRMLSRLGCKVFTAENGRVALNMLMGTTETPDSDTSKGSGPILDRKSLTRSSLEIVPTNYPIVFLDNQMPVMSGLQLVAQLRTMGRDDFVVGVTGNALRSDQEEYIEAGVDRVLTKPVLEVDLKSMLTVARERFAKAARSPPT